MICVFFKHTIGFDRDFWTAKFPVQPGFPRMTSYCSSAAWTPCQWCGDMLCSVSWAGDSVGKEDEVKDRGDTHWNIMEH